MKTTKKAYQAPEVEQVEMRVEQGFAGSFTSDENPFDDVPWNDNSGDNWE